MDATRTPVRLDDALLDPKTISWDKYGLTANVPLSLSHSRTHTVLVPKTAANRMQDTAVADWKLSFTTMVQVPSAGSTARIGSSGAPIIIQIESSPQSTVRPQTGMQQADMIYEYISEFGIPRLSAIYWHPPSSLIGPACKRLSLLATQRADRFRHRDPGYGDETGSPTEVPA